MTRSAEREKTEKVQRMLSEGVPVEEILKVMKWKLCHFKMFLRSKRMRSIRARQREMMELQRQVVLEQYEARRDLEMVAELARGGDPGEQARLAKLIRQRQESEERKAAREEVREEEISEDEAREAMRKDAERFERKGR
jgi:hypothetical protein